MKTYQDKNSPLYEGLPFMEIEGQGFTFPCRAEIKLDGEFQYVIKRKGKLYLANKPEHGRIRTDMPVLNEIEDKIPDDSVFLAELVWGRGDDFYAFARHKLDPNCSLGFFGCVRFAGKQIWNDWTYVATRDLLEQQKFYTPNAVLIPSVIVANEQELDDLYEIIVNGGYEGLIAKTPESKYTNKVTYEWTKRKYETEGDFVIMGYQSGTKRAKMLSVLVGHLVDGVVVPLSYVGGGFGIDTVPKETMLTVLQGIVTGNKGDEIYVEQKLVVEIKYSGVIRKEDGSVNSLRHPQFKCVRMDKSVEHIDTVE